MTLRIKQGETDANLRKKLVRLVASDGVTPVTGAAPIVTGELKLCKANTTTPINGAATLAEIGTGLSLYWLTFAVTDIDTLGPLSGIFQRTGVDPFAFEIEVTANSDYVANAITARDIAILEKATCSSNTGTNTVPCAVGSTVKRGDILDFSSILDGQMHVVTLVSGSPPVATVNPVLPSALQGQAPTYIRRAGVQSLTGTEAPITNIDSSSVAAIAAASLSSIKADPEWKTILANVNGQWTVVEPSAYPGTVTLTLTDKTGTPPATRATLALFCLTRPSVLSRTSS